MVESRNLREHEDNFCLSGRKNRCFPCLPISNVNIMCNVWSIGNYFEIMTPHVHMLRLVNHKVERSLGLYEDHRVPAPCLQYDYLQKQVAQHMWQMGHSLSTPSLDCLASDLLSSSSPLLLSHCSSSWPLPLVFFHKGSSSCSHLRTNLLQVLTHKKSSPGLPWPLRHLSWSYMLLSSMLCISLFITSSRRKGPMLL
jgi:hypothetical protein